MTKSRVSRRRPGNGGEKGTARVRRGMRLIMDLVEECVLAGGYVLFTGCAAGDTGAAVVMKVTG